MTAMEPFAERVARRSAILAEGSVYELLHRDASIELDEQIAHAGLIYDDAARHALASIHLAYAAIASQHGLPLLAFTDTWRASTSRIAASRFAGRQVNADNVAFLRDLLGRRAYVAGLTGSAGDAYRPETAPSRAEALAYHAGQIADLAAAGVDVLFAATLPSTREAQVIGELMSATGLPWMLSFVVRPDGTVLDGVPLSDAMRAIDALERPPIGYAINCVHSSAAASAVRSFARADTSRLIAFQGNASALPPEELDGRAEIDAESADAFARGMMVLAAADVPILGGCCGTSPEHLEALAAALHSTRS